MEGNCRAEDHSGHNGTMHDTAGAAFDGDMLRNSEMSSMDLILTGRL
jgi:hypothetical protein